MDRQTDRWTEGRRGRFSLALGGKALRLGQGQYNLTVAAATPSCSTDLTQLAPCSPCFPLLPGYNCPPTPHIILTQHTTHTCTHIASPTRRGGPPCGGPVTLPGPRQVVGVERARERQPAARGTLPVGTEITGALPQCRAQCTHEDNRPTHMLVLRFL